MKSIRWAVVLGVVVIVLSVGMIAAVLVREAVADPEDALTVVRNIVVIAGSLGLFGLAVWAYDELRDYGWAAFWRREDPVAKLPVRDLVSNSYWKELHRGTLRRGRLPALRDPGHQPQRPGGAPSGAGQGAGV